VETHSLTKNTAASAPRHWASMNHIAIAENKPCLI